MNEDIQNYVADGVNAVEFKLVRNKEDVKDDSISFNPEMAHQIFGETEKIFGYKNLKIILYYNAGSLNVYFDVKYSNKIELSEHNVKADDIANLVTEKLPMGSYITNLEEFLSTVDKDEKFHPLGEKISEYEVKTEDNVTRTFEFYFIDTPNQKFINYHKRFETFVLWFVDAASYIDHDDPNWIYFICYEKYKNKNGNWCYASVGYSTIYQYYAYPTNIRARLSQILILPPFQRLGIGTKLIETIYNHFKGNDKITEITVEDPSDDFQSVRNYIDARICMKLPAFSVDLLKKGFSKEMAKEAKEVGKINAIQCRRVYEILRLLNTNRNDDEEYRQFRLDIKKRLNMIYTKQKKDIERLEKRGMDTTAVKLALTPIAERIDQLHVEFKVCEAEYERVVKRLKNDL